MGREKQVWVDYSDLINEKETCQKAVASEDKVPENRDSNIKVNVHYITQMRPHHLSGSPSMAHFTTTAFEQL